MLLEKNNKNINCLRYKGKWSSSQKELLNVLDSCILDSRHNVVVASGANRFDIALEILSKYNTRALILTDNHITRSIWRSRIFSHFIDSELKDEVSTNIRLPKFVTVVTYQTLFNAFLGQAAEYDTYRNRNKNISPLPQIRPDKASEIIEIFKKAGIDTVVFDEPQYLSDDFMRTVEYLTEHFSVSHQLTISENVPLDLPLEKKLKYDEVFGKINAAITSYDLIKNNTLCPHQDFVYFVEPTDEECELISDYKKRLKLFLPFILNNAEFIKKIYSSPIMQKSENYIEQIMQNPLFFISIASLFKSNNLVIPDAFMELFDADDSDIPDFRIKEAECLILGLPQFTKYFYEIDSEIQEIKNALRRYEFINNNVLSLNYPKNLTDVLYSTMNKINAIEDITKNELLSLQHDLRLFIIATTPDEQNLETSLFSAFHAIKAVDGVFKDKFNVALISETITLIPESILNSFYDILKSKYINRESVVVTPFSHLNGYLKVQTKDSLRNSLNRSILKMFSLGILQAIVSSDTMYSDEIELNDVNSLIFAIPNDNNKFVYKYRSLFTKYSFDNPERVVNIFHIGCVFEQNTDDVFMSSLPQKNTVSQFNLSSVKDFENLSKRFEAIEGLSSFKPCIRNSIERLLPANYTITDVDDIIALNEFQMKNTNRENVIYNWEMAKNHLLISQKCFIEGLETNNEPRTLVCQTGYYYLLTGVLLAFFTTIYFKPQFFVFALLISMLLLIFPTVKVFIMATPDKLIYYICKIILKCLYLQGNIDTKPNSVRIKILNKFNGSKFIYTPSLTENENRIFVKSLCEFFSEIKTPTYLIVRKSNYFGIFEQKDYHSFPEIFADNRNLILKFKSFWKSKLGNCKVYYTGNDDGRYILLQAWKREFDFIEKYSTKIVGRYF